MAKNAAEAAPGSSAVERKIRFWLRANGFALGVHGRCRIKHGLPLTPNVLVRPKFSNKVGSRTIMVTTTEVMDCYIDPGAEYWRVETTSAYESEEDLIRILNELCNIPDGMWLDKEGA